MKGRGILTAALAGAVVMLAGCKDSTGSSDKPTNSNAGVLSFTYSGARSGSYSVNGEYKVSGSSFVKQPFAVAATDNSAGETDILAYSPTSSTTGTLAVFILPAVNSATTVDLSCSGATCGDAIFGFNVNPDVTTTTGETYYEITSGTLRVTSVSNGRMKGTFSGTAEDVDSTDQITITNGTFDVPVLTSSTNALNRAIPHAAFSRIPRR